jgi:hypothetical protein
MGERRRRGGAAVHHSRCARHSGLFDLLRIAANLGWFMAAFAGIKAAVLAIVVQAMLRVVGRAWAPRSAKRWRRVLCRAVPVRPAVPAGRPGAGAPGRWSRRSGRNGCACRRCRNPTSPRPVHGEPQPRQC